MTINMNYVIIGAIGIFIVSTNGQSTDKNELVTGRCNNPTLNNSQIPQCCNATNYRTWMVNINEKAYNWHLGIGVVLHPKAVLTFADRISNINTDNIRITACANDCQIRKVSKIFIQPVHFTYGYNNLAILILSAPLEINKDVSNICWMNSNGGIKDLNGFKTTRYIFHRESYVSPSLIIGNKSQNHHVLIKSRTQNLLFADRRENNLKTYTFLGFETIVKYTTSERVSNTETFFHYLSPNFPWINRILNENFNPAIANKTESNNVKKVLFKLNLHV